MAESQAEQSQILRFMEDQSHYFDQRQVNQALRQRLELRPGQRWLEVGSGSGALCRLAAADLLPDGWIAGLDVSPFYLQAAAGLCRQYSSIGNIRFTAGTAYRLPFHRGCWDGAFAARLMLNVEDPDAVLAEMKRVVRPGGRIVLLDWDFDTLIVDHSRRELTRRLLRWRADHYGSDGWSGRLLRGRLVAGGLEAVEVWPVVTIGVDESAALTDALRRAAKAALEGGGIDLDEYKLWIEELDQRLAADRFFASLVYFIAAGCVP